MACTIYDLAEAAGVSIATVSRALNDHYAVSEETKTRILKLAEEMDYRPNARARSFAAAAIANGVSPAIIAASNKEGTRSNSL